MDEPKAVSAEEAREWTELALLADAFSGLNHAINNHLNGMMLQAAALQIRVADEFREGLDRIRKEGAQAAGLFRAFGQFRQQVRDRFAPIDLAPLLKASVAEQPEKKWTLAAPQRATVAATPGTAARLLRYLFTALTDHHQGSKPATATLSAGPPITLALEIVPADDQARVMLQRLCEGKEQDLPLPLLAGLSLLRLLDGRMECSTSGRKLKLSLIW
jgi:hypothetical protein